MYQEEESGSSGEDMLELGRWSFGDGRQSEDEAHKSIERCLPLRAGRDENINGT